MLEKWTGEVVGEMHIHRITAQQLAEELGVSNRWVSAVLNGHRTSKNAEQQFKTAVNNIISREG